MLLLRARAADGAPPGAPPPAHPPSARRALRPPLPLARPSDRAPPSSPASPSIKEGGRLLAELRATLQQQLSERKEQERTIFKLSAQLRLAQQRGLARAAPAADAPPPSGSAPPPLAVRTASDGGSAARDGGAELDGARGVQEAGGHTAQAEKPARGALGANASARAPETSDAERARRSSHAPCGPAAGKTPAGAGRRRAAPSTATPLRGNKENSAHASSAHVPHSAKAPSELAVKRRQHC